MNKINDNIGGFKKIEFLAINRIQSIYGSGFLSVILKENEHWINLPFQPGSSAIDVSPERTDAGIIYESSIEIAIPRQYLTVALDNEIDNLIIFGGIIRYTTQHDEMFIIGNTDYPLQATSQYIHPGSASGFTHLKLELTGKSTLPQLPFR